ncbi:hypothetical protein ES703_83080 [subsurface metagenome]
MIEWFKNLTDANKIAIVVPIAVVVIGGLIGLFKWLFGKKKDPDFALEIIDDTLKENRQLRQTVKELEEQLAKPSLETNIALEQSTPAPSAEARELANLITEDDGIYAQALKAIAEGDNEKADSLLDETQQFLDTVQQRKDEAQVKIYMARMQNASYAARPQDALQYCGKLTTLAGNDSLIINKMAVVYYKNAKYKEAEPLMARALKIDEASLGKDHPKVAIRLNNLAQLYKATNRLKEAEPLMQRALKIDEASLGKDHPTVAIRLIQRRKVVKVCGDIGMVFTEGRFIYLQRTLHQGLCLFKAIGVLIQLRQVVKVYGDIGMVFA